MRVFSIDLGIDANAIGGAEGTLSDPYPLQIAVNAGELRDNVFQPTQIVSWRELVSKDELIFRVFDITLPDDACGLSRSLVGVASITAALRDRCGNPLPFTPAATKQIAAAPTAVRSLAFKDPSTSDFACFFEHETAGGTVAHYRLPEVKTRSACLLSVTVVATLQEGSEKIERVFGDDPEMVVSPDVPP